MAEQVALKVSDEVAVSIENMNKWYGTFHELRDIDLTVYQGERIVLFRSTNLNERTPTP